MDGVTPFREVLEDQLKDPEFRAFWEQRNEEDLSEEEDPPQTWGTGWCAPSP